MTRRPGLLPGGASAILFLTDRNRSLPDRDTIVAIRTALISMWMKRTLLYNGEVKAEEPE